MAVRAKTTATEEQRYYYASVIRPRLFTSPAGSVARYCIKYVCVSVCLSARISSEPHMRSLSIFVHVAYGRDSVLLRRFGDTLCTSGFVDEFRFEETVSL